MGLVRYGREKGKGERYNGKMYTIFNLVVTRDLIYRLSIYLIRIGAETVGVLLASICRRYGVYLPSLHLQASN